MSRQKLEQLVFLFFMTFLMGLVLSFTLQLRDTGFAGFSGFVQAWLWRFLETYVIVLPLVLILSPVARRLTQLVLGMSHRTQSSHSTSEQYQREAGGTR